MNYAFFIENKPIEIVMKYLFSKNSDWLIVFISFLTFSKLQSIIKDRNSKAKVVSPILEI
jgi:hypothetical protein